MNTWEERMATKARLRREREIEETRLAGYLSPREAARYLSEEDKWRFEEAYIRDEVARTTVGEVENRIPFGCACPGAVDDHMICPCILQAEVDNRVLGAGLANPEQSCSRVGEW